MDAIRARFGSAFEWLLAAFFLFATFVVASLIARELRAVSSRPAPVEESIPVSAMPATVPPGAVSVPVLVLTDNRQVRVGDTMVGVARLLGRESETGELFVDRGMLGERLTRFYEYANTRFILVFEPLEHGGELRVGAIYLR
ncbi:MAG: hypothetical protein HYX76_12115 [Acidobacteria bacterium]|nr:hypothetical protein [Acidobacteriota bacterium]